MKKLTIFCILLLLFLFSQILHAQYMMPPQPGSGFISGGLGYSQIGDKGYVSMHFRPELAFGKIGIGLNLELNYNTETGSFRKEDWDEPYDYFRILRYVRYGVKSEPFYARVGALDLARIGNGFLMNYYTNEAANYDARRIGLAFDLDLGIVGFESMTSNLGRMEIYGLRAYARPLQQITDVPIIKNLTFGTSWISDVDPDEKRDTNDEVSAFGLDVGLPLIDSEYLGLGLYYDFGQIVDYGKGHAYGVGMHLKGLANIFDLWSKFERRNIGKEFLPAFFNAYYEVERFQRTASTDDEGATVFEEARKTDLLALQTKDTHGWYAELGGHLLNMFNIVGTYQWMDENPNGVAHVQARNISEIMNLHFHASWDKVGIQSTRDINLDNSIAAVGIGYKIAPWTVVYMDYRYTFYEDENGVTKSQKRFMPSVSFIYDFSW